MHKSWIAVSLVLLALIAGIAQPAAAGSCGSRAQSSACATQKAGCASSAACATQASAASGESSELMTIVQKAASLGSCNTFVNAVKAAELVGPLSGEGPFTVFVPSDEAFSRVPPAQMEALLKDPVKLSALLRQHVVAGNLCASSLCEQKETQALAGSALAVSAQGEEIRVNGARVVTADLRCRNGLVHVIDHVILPGQPS